MSIEIKELNFSYNKNKILNNIDILFTPGEISVIAGPNGSGKSTILKLIMDLLKSHNSVYLDNKEINEYNSIERAKKIGYVPQNSYYDFDFSVLDIVEMGRFPFKKNWDSDADRKAVENALKQTDTFHLRRRGINSLSGGELQRVLLARALTCNPSYLILDEPSSNLDMNHNMEMMNLLNKLTSEKKLTTILVLHDFNSILKYSNNTILLKNGSIQYIGKTKEVIHPNNIFQIFNMKTELVKDSKGNNHLVVL